jgi:hypothetical protein
MRDRDRCHTHPPESRPARSRLAILLALALPLAGCGAEGMAVFLGLNAATLNTTGRSVPDIAASLHTGKDCLTTNVKLGKPYCRDLRAEALARLQQPKETCFRSLGQIQCYRSEVDPYSTRKDPVH